MPTLLLTSADSPKAGPLLNCADIVIQTRGGRYNVRSGISGPTVRSCGKVWATSSFPQSFLNSSHLCVRGASADWPGLTSNRDVTPLCTNDVTGMALNASHVTFSTLKWIRDASDSSSLAFLGLYLKCWRKTAPNMSTEQNNQKQTNPKVKHQNYKKQMIIIQHFYFKVHRVC